VLVRGNSGTELTLGEIADAHHEHPDLPPGRLPNGLWKCIGCGRIVPKNGRWLNWCSDCGYDLWEG
jgi:hypothetical protein